MAWNNGLTDLYRGAGGCPEEGTGLSYVKFVNIVS